jgi:hypothetical protein
VDFDISPPLSIVNYIFVYSLLVIIVPTTRSWNKCHEVHSSQRIRKPASESKDLNRIFKIGYFMWFLSLYYYVVILPLVSSFSDIINCSYFDKMNILFWNSILYITFYWWNGVFNLCQHFEISYSTYANKHFITGVYITINDSYR